MIRKSIPRKSRSFSVVFLVFSSVFILMISTLPLAHGSNSTFTTDQAATLVLGQSIFTTSTASTTASGLNGPGFTTFDSAGNLWVSDEANNRVLEYAAPFSTGESASLVLGQSSFMTSSSAVSAGGLSDPRGLAFDSFGNLWVADSNNNRVLEYAAPLTNGEAATLVLGQSSFTSNTSATSATGEYAPTGLAFDTLGNLWVADTGNQRTIEYTTPFTNGEAATLVLGQSSFTSNTSATSAAGELVPSGLALDGRGNLWVADSRNNRVIEYTTPFTNGEAATLVLGQSSFTSNTFATSATGETNPNAVAFDSSGNLWVADTTNSRVLEYTAPFSTDEAASLVLGQSSFTTSTTATSASGLMYPRGLAFDSSGNLWVADNYNNRVLEYAQSSVSTTTTSTTSSTTSTASTTSAPPPPTMAHVSITLNPDLTSNPISANNYFLVSYNDGAQEFTPQQGGTLQVEAAIGSLVSIAARSSTSNSQEEWCIWGTPGNCNSIQFSVAASGNTVTYTYYDLLSQVVSYAIHGGGNPNPPSLSYLTLASSANSQDNLGLSSITLSSNAQTIWALRTFSGARPIQLSGFGIINTSPATPNEQWSAGFGTCCAILGPDVIPNPIVFYNQYPQQVSFSVTGSGTGFSAPTLNYVSAGSAQTLTLTQSAFSLFLDAGSSWSVTPNPLAGSILGNSWTASSGTVGTVTGPGTIDPVYVEVFGQIAANLQESFGVGDTFAPSTQTPLSEGVSISDKYVAPSTSSLFDGIVLKDTYIAPLTAPLFDGITVNDYFVSPIKSALNDLVGFGETITSSSFLSVGKIYSGNIFFIVHSPVNILVTDTQGRQAGFNSTGGMINTIPGAQIFPKNSTQLETIIIPDPLSGQYAVEVFPVNGGGNYTVELQSTNANGTVVADTRQTGSVTSGNQYLGVTLTPSGQVTETPPSITPPFQNKSSATSFIITVAVIAAAIAVAGSALFVFYRGKRR